jgi:hypothetical protein
VHLASSDRTPQQINQSQPKQFSPCCHNYSTSDTWIQLGYVSGVSVPISLSMFLLESPLNLCLSRSREWHKPNLQVRPITFTTPSPRTDYCHSHNRNCVSRQKQKQESECRGVQTDGVALSRPPLNSVSPSHLSPLG